MRLQLSVADMASFTLSQLLVVGAGVGGQHGVRRRVLVVAAVVAVSMARPVRRGGGPRCACTCRWRSWHRSFCPNLGGPSRDHDCDGDRQNWGKADSQKALKVKVKSFTQSLEPSDPLFLPRMRRASSKSLGVTVTRFA